MDKIVALPRFGDREDTEREPHPDDNIRVMAKPALNGMQMWYVIQVLTGKEERCRQLCGKLVDASVLERCFLPYYIEKKRFRGQWREVKKILFPGYLFVITNHPEKLHDVVRQVPGMTRLLKTGDEIFPLSREESEFLLRFGQERQIVPLSEGVIEGGRTVVTAGPLQGMEGYLVKIDRHKRKAYLEIPMFGRTTKVCVGLEIVEKN